MASMDPWTHPALHKVTPIDPMLTDGLESMGQDIPFIEPEKGLGVWTTALTTQIIGAGLDFLSTSKQLDLQKDQIAAQLVAAQKAKEVALLQLEAAKVQREAAAAQATADAKAAEARSAGFGLDVGKLILPVAIAGGVALLFFMKGKKKK